MSPPPPYGSVPDLAEIYTGPRLLRCPKMINHTNEHPNTCVQILELTEVGHFLPKNVLEIVFLAFRIRMHANHSRSNAVSLFSHTVNCDNLKS